MQFNNTYMTKKNEQQDQSLVSDEQNPNLLFTGIHTDLLVQIVNEQIDVRKLALEQLRNRDLDKNGKWIGDSDDRHPYL